MPVRFVGIRGATPLGVRGLARLLVVLRDVGVACVACLVCLTCVCAEPSLAARAPEAAAPETFPGKDWVRWDSSEAAGYSSARLDALRAWLKANQTTAMLVVVDGKVLFEYGDLARVSKIASVRKSVLAMLYGKYVDSGVVDLNKTVKQLGLDDVQPFIQIETHATLLHLLTARSGIYLPAGSGPSGSGADQLLARSPRRGAQAPGTYFQYQNWDFNAAGTAFEKLTGKDIFDALETDLARPIGMQDFDRSRQRKNSGMPETVHPEYAMSLSTRDMARLGLLMLRGGTWNGAQVLPRDWGRTITSLVTRHEDMHPVQLGVETGARRWGYGLLWWVWDAPSWPQVVTGPYQGAHAAMGANGQYIVILPAMDLVIAHKVDIDEDGTREVQDQEFDAILQMVIGARFPER